MAFYDEKSGGCYRRKGGTTPLMPIVLKCDV